MFYTKQSYMCIDDRYTIWQRIRIWLANELLVDSVCIVECEKMVLIDQVDDYKQQATIANSQYHLQAAALEALKEQHEALTQSNVFQFKK